MQTKLFWLGLALATVVTCRLGAWLYELNAYCQSRAGGWSCHEQTILLDITIMVVPLGVLIVRGVYVGLRHLQHTRQAVHRVLALGTSHLPHDVLQRASALAIAERIDVVACTRAAAFCYGVLRPRICITTGLLAVLEPAEVEAVLRHERHHLQRRDPLRSLLWTMLCSVCWWLEERAAHADLVRELAADRAVIEEQGRTPLARALLKLVTHPRDDDLSGLAISGLSVTDARIEQLLKPDQQPMIAQAPVVGWWVFAPLALLVYVSVCSMIMAHI
jgi:beta-lactamase regulating signal transducer with metallopeptidase domain